MNPLELAAHVEERYRRYLKTTFTFKDPELARSFAQALDRDRLAKGPFLDATPVYERGATPASLFTELLGVRPDEGLLTAVRGDRPLYRHQDAAIRKIHAGRNVVVATGTGSGKTEAFLYPILLELWRQQARDQLGAGVRALVLYPMNALANDQRDRLGAPPLQTGELGGIAYELDRTGSPFEFTYGQYIGQTPEDRPSRNQPVFVGELATREQMRRTPPHVLLTNYSMLEYLLLRPTDSPLFDGEWARTWKFLVLDEAHQYRGSKGVEMAMLIRRLKRRLRESGNTNNLTCIATSASLSEGSQNVDAVARFASDLFDEPFDPSDIIGGEFRPLQEGGPIALDSRDYQAMADALSGGASQATTLVSDIRARLGIPRHPVRDLPSEIGELLGADARASRLRKLITGQPMPVADAAADCFGDLNAAKQVDALATLTSVMAQCRDETGAPLLTGRYHLFLKATEGAYVSYVPHKAVYLDKKAGENSFEVAVCRECGQHYFVGRIENGKLTEAIRDTGDPHFGADFFRPLAPDDDGEDNENDDEVDDGAADKRAKRRAGARDLYVLCVRCGAIGGARAGCLCDAEHRIRVRKEKRNDHRADEIVRCGACGYSASGRDPVRELTSGTDGPHAVIAQTLYQFPPENERKVLAFTDGRQEAAFFAWYFEASYRDILRRNLLLSAAQEASQGSPGGVSIDRLARQLRDLFRSRKAFSATKTAADLLDDAYAAVYSEILTSERRISLEGVGAIEWFVELPDAFELPNMLREPPWSLSIAEARAVVQELLDTLRQAQSMEIVTSEKATISADALGIHQTDHTLALPRTVARPTRGRPARYWDGPSTSRVRYLKRLCMRRARGIGDDQAQQMAVDALRAIWESIARFDRSVRSPQEGILIAGTVPKKWTAE